MTKSFLCMLGVVLFIASCSHSTAGGVEDPLPEMSDDSPTVIEVVLGLVDGGVIDASLDSSNKADTHHGCQGGHEGDHHDKDRDKDHKHHHEAKDND
jgi:hypothetical protein